jgi:hypothetical protein
MEGLEGMDLATYCYEKYPIGANATLFGPWEQNTVPMDSSSMFSPPNRHVISILKLILSST